MGGIKEYITFDNVEYRVFRPAKRGVIFRPYTDEEKKGWPNAPQQK